MDVIELTRQLGAEIQASEEYKAFTAAKVASENDAEVNDKMAKIEEIRAAYQAAAMDPNPDEKLLGKLDKDFQDVYASLMVSDTMAAYEEAREALDSKMNYIMQILYLCVNGEDPATCEPPEEHECGGDCGCCSSDCGC
ncbi:MAG: YlbF family regulator [Clostridia bacterium]|nr:YlbF family regulator [Clostridia bacterium]